MMVSVAKREVRGFIPKWVHAVVINIFSTAFSLCTLWAVEALTRCGAYDKKMLQRAVSMFEDFLGCE